MKKLNYFKTGSKATPIDVEAYLKRLGVSREEPSLNALRKMHSAHVHTIPFENLDIHYTRKIQLDYKKIFNKLVTEKRGGFCYELNGLFYHLLSHLGYQCHIASAQMRKDSGDFSPDFDHMIIILTLEERNFLVDVGFGNSFSYPKELATNVVQMDYTTYWKFEKDPDENFLLRYSDDTTVFHTKYRFNTSEKQIIQFMEMCEFHQTSEASSFTQKKLITIKTREGRVTLTDRKLKITRLGETTEMTILNEDEFLSKLEQYFGISWQQLRQVKD
ncbi:MAG: arylamine N-acetyltransferase [Cyclobacteriaceae bacterium]